LMEMYTRWMDGNCFQNSTVNEAFEGMDPQSHGAEIEDTTKKKKVAKKEKSVAEMAMRCQICGGNHLTDECPNKNAPRYPMANESEEWMCESCGAMHKGKKPAKKKAYSEGLMPEELIGTTYEIEMEDGETIIIEKVKMDGKDDNGFKSCWKGYRKAGTKVKGDKEVNNCVKAGYEMEGGEELEEKAPPGAKYERMVKHVKKGYSKDGLTDKEKGIAYATAWKAKNKAVKEGLDPVGKEDKDIDNDGDHDKSDKYLHARRKKIGKILAMKKKS